ncbi:MAG: hypothetical protein WBL19_02260 [Minisyncoccia bacterium]
MDLIPQISIFFGNNTQLISFFAVMIGGEGALLLLSLYSASGILNFKYVFIFSYLGVMVSDTMWYLVAKSKLFEWFTRIKLVSSAYNYWGRLLDLATKKKDFEALFITKFLYGLRIPTITYLSRERLSLKNFLKYSLLSNLLWVAIISAIGWGTGRGVKFFGYFSDSIIIQTFLVGIILIFFIIIMRVVSRRVKQWLQNR